MDSRLKGSGASRDDILKFAIEGVTDDTIYSYALRDLGFAAHIADFAGFSVAEESARFGGSTAIPVPGALMLLGLAAIRRRARKFFK